MRIGAVLHRDVANREQAVLFGGPLADLIEAADALPHLMFGFDGSDTLRGGADCDTLRGGAGDDWLVSQGGADLVLGNSGHDTIFGRAGDDTLIGGGGSDWLDGGIGTNTVSYFGSTTGVFVDLQGNGALEGTGAWDVIVNFQNIVGGIADDTLQGNAQHNLIQALDGDDTVFGLAGNDTLRGAAGDDDVFGGVGDDGLAGGIGNDDLHGQHGNDTLRGGLGDDVLSGGDGNDVLVGEQGQDIYSGGTGADRFVFLAASNLATSGRKADVILDFVPGTDVIDFRGITGDGTGVEGVFLGTAAFSGAGSFEVRAVYNANGNAQLQLDVDGDGFDDGVVVVLDVSDLTTSDLLL